MADEILLSDEERAGLRSDLDQDALETLLSRLTAPERALLLRSLAKDYGRDPSTSQSVVANPRFENAELQDLLDQVWRPVGEAHRAKRRAKFPAGWTELDSSFRIVLALTEHDAGNTGARVLRMPENYEKDIIVLAPSRSQPIALAAALHTLMISRQQGLPTSIQSISVMKDAFVPSLPDCLMEVLERTLNLALSGPISEVPYVGKARNSELSLIL
jgi:hypothetical protein